MLYDLAIDEELEQMDEEDAFKGLERTRNSDFAKGSDAPYRHY